MGLYHCFFLSETRILWINDVLVQSALELCKKTGIFQVDYRIILHSYTVYPFFCPLVYITLHQILTLLLIWTILPNLTFYVIVRGFHRTFAMGAACQQRTLTPPDTWPCTTWELASVLKLRPISPELVSGLLSFEHPSALLFCFLWIPLSKTIIFYII